MQPESLDRISAEQIAELAGVSNSAVSNWTARFEDFPKPLDTTGGRHTFYARAEVVAWLTTRRPGYADKLSGPERRFWRLADRLRAIAAPSEVLETLIWLVVLNMRRGSIPDEPSDAANAVMTVAGDVGAEAARVLTSGLDNEAFEAMRSIAHESVREPQDVIELLLEASLKSTRELGPRGDTDLYPTLAALADIQPGDRVIDLYPRLGDGLAIIHARQPDVVLAGRVHSEIGLRIVSALNAARGLNVELQLITHRANRKSTHLFNRVLGVVPHRREIDDLVVDKHRGHLGAPSSSSALSAWVQECLDDLRPGGRAVLAVSRAMLTRHLSYGGAVPKAVAAGAITAVIRAPGNRRSANGPRFFVVISQPDRPMAAQLAHVLMIDLELAPDRPAQWHLWGSGQFDDTDDRCRLTTANEISANRFSLDPALYATRKTTSINVAAVTKELEASLLAAEHALEELRSRLSDVIVPTFDNQRTKWRHATLEQLRSTGHIAVDRSMARMAKDETGISVLNIGYLMNPNGQARSFTDDASTTTVSTGDLIVPLMGVSAKSLVVTERENGWALGMGVARIRTLGDLPGIEPGWLELWVKQPSFTEDCRRRASFLGDSWRLSIQDLLQIEIPLPPADVQQAAVRHGQIIHRFELTAQRASSALAAVAAESNALLADRLLSDAPPQAIAIRPPAAPTTLPLAGAGHATPDRGRLRLRRGNAHASRQGDRFVVHAGSLARKVATKSLGQRYVELREQLMADGDLVVDGDNLLVLRDVSFDSPTAAACVLMGTNVNGLMLWLLPDGRSLRDLKSQAPVTEP